MKISCAKYTLQFRHPFGLAHSTRSTTPTVYLRLEHEGKEGYGEATLPPYLGETQESVVAFFQKASGLLDAGPEECLQRLSEIDRLEAGNSAAKAAIDIALHDLMGQIRNVPAYELLGTARPAPKETSVTIAIGDLSLLQNKLEELKDFHLLKLKLGHANDKEVVTRIRELTPKPFVVDVNQGWTTKEHALEMIGWLAERNTLYVEQPLAKDDFANMRWLREKSPLPVLADESFQRFADLDQVAACFSGINLKLMKCTGLAEGKKILNKARELGLKINIGCMSESSCGIAAAAQLMAVADWIDLDGPMLIRNDPFEGVHFESGRLHLAQEPGTGAAPNKSTLHFVRLFE